MSYIKVEFKHTDNQTIHIINAAQQLGLHIGHIIKLIYQYGTYLIKYGGSNRKHETDMHG